MAFLPELPTWDKQVLNTQTFAGLNRGLSIADGEMADMLNMTGDYYPVLATRRARNVASFAVDGGGQAIYPEGISGMIGGDKLVVCSGEHVYVDGVKHGLKLSADEAMNPKHLVGMGAYICIWPDKKYLNLTNPDDFGDMGSRWVAEGDRTISAMMCRKDGTNYDENSISVGNTAPESPQDQQFWLDTSVDSDVLKQYSDSQKQWVSIATTFIKIQATGIGNGIKEGDVVHLSGAAAAGNTTQSTIGDETLSFAADGFNLYSSFRTVLISDSDGQRYESTTPTTAEQTKVITVSGIPDGAVVTGAVVKFKASYPMYGKKLLAMNGVSFGYGGDVELPVEVAGNGDVTLKFRFQSGNNATGVGEHGGSITISNLVLEVSYAVSGASDEDNEQVNALNTTNTVYGCGNDYIIVAGLLRKSMELAGTLVRELKIPDLDYVCEANNRIWGCSYATVDGALTNEIRCCALGDFRNWYRFDGTSQDSYVMSVGSDGKFTAAYSLQGIPLLWKEGYLHKISGTQPSNFMLNTLRCRGVQDGSWRSMAAVNEVLVYKSRQDVMVYDGAMPYAIGEPLGKERYTEAVGGAYRDKYFVNMRGADLGYSTYVFDVSKGLWHKEDEASIRHMASSGGELYLAVDQRGTDTLMVVGSQEGQQESFGWMVTFGKFGFQTEQQKYLSRFNIRAQLSKGSTMTLEIQYDSDGKWVNMGTVRSAQFKTFTLPVVPRRCDHCQVRLSGNGTCKIYSVAREFETGGDG